MSRANTGDAAEERLTTERNAKQEELSKQRTQFADVQKRIERLQSLTALLDQTCANTKQSIADIENEIRQRVRKSPQEPRPEFRCLDEDIEKHRAQWTEAKSQHDLILERCASYQERAEAEEGSLANAISEARYARQLLMARYDEVHARVESMRKLLRASHPDVDLNAEIPVLGPAGGSVGPPPRDLNAKQREKMRLELECRRITEELEAYKD
jgi:chromosome segregation ATPase